MSTINASRGEGCNFRPGSNSTKRSLIKWLRLNAYIARQPQTRLDPAASPRNPEAGMSRIIQLSAFSRPTNALSDKRPLGQRMREAKPPLPSAATETAKNSRIRSARRDAWWRAERISGYWRARLDWQDALGTAQKWENADSASFPSAK